MGHKTFVIDIKRNALDDGPGIRTLVFFKGCPLSCVWCQNPEAKNPLQEISLDKEDCVECKECLTVCDQNAIDFSNENRIDRNLCNLCENCIDICPSNALKIVGKPYDIEDLVKLILRDKIFYGNSGGGVTFSGGEPLYHIDFIHKLSKRLKEEDIHICIETCGYYNSDKFNNLILPYTDLIYFDLKLINPKLHLKFCKADNAPILKNFENLLKLNRIEVLPRIPLIPNITTMHENLTNFATYLEKLHIKKIGLLPYNPLWILKCENLGIKPLYDYSEWLNKEEKDKIKKIFSKFDFKDF